MYGIKTAYCKGNVWQRDKAIRLFNIDDSYKVIMLSSESAASGTNLTKAQQVILLDPVSGSYEYRRNTEWQAIGRAHRMG
jgi:SNF2 family DNA or RNA helicase